MTHEEAADGRAAEKYVLSELSPEERADFEQHFFDCSECAESVRLGEILAANAREVFLQQADSQAAPRPAGAIESGGFAKWLWPAFVFALALVVLLTIANGVLLNRLSRLGAPQSYPAFFLRGTARGDEQVLTIPRTARFVGVSVDVPPGRRFLLYRCSLADASGRQRLSADLTAPADSQAALNLLIPTSDLVPGRYDLVLGGIDGAALFELGRYPFQLQFP